jgi:FtsH-binding integral membrane protein
MLGSRTLIGLAAVQGAAAVVAAALGMGALALLLGVAAVFVVLGEWAGSRELSPRGRHRQNLGLALTGIVAFAVVAVLTAAGVPDWSILRLGLSIVGVCICVLWANSEIENLRDTR